MEAKVGISANTNILILKAIIVHIRITDSFVLNDAPRPHAFYLLCLTSSRATTL
jgi:hypothetical protein